MDREKTEIPQLKVKETPPNCPIPPPCPVCPSKPKPWQIGLKALLLLGAGLVLALIILVGSGLRITRKESLLDIWLAGRRGVSPTPEILATPTPDPTADWKTYTNEEYDFEFKYPSNKTAEFLEEPYNGFCNENKRRGLVNLLLWPEGKKLPVVGEEIGVSDVSLFIYGEENKNNLSLEKWIEKNCPQLLSGYKKENYEISGLSAVKYTRIGEGVGAPEIQPYIFLLKNNKLFYVHPYGDKEIFDQILSTFKFLE